MTERKTRIVATGDDGRKALIKAIHAMQRELTLEDDGYRDLLARVADGKRSCKDMTERQLGVVADEMRRLGAGRKPRRAGGPKRAGGRKMAPGGHAAKIRALWLALYHLAQIDDPSEAALVRFVKKTTGIEALEWLGPADADKAIKALRGWCRRVGFREPTARRVREIDDARAGAGLPPGRHGFAAKVALIGLQWRRLRDAVAFRAPQDRDLGGWPALHGVTAPPLLAAHQADNAIETLGSALRNYKAGDRADC